MRAPANYYLPEDADPEPAPKRKRAKAVNLEAGIQAAVLKYLRLSLPGALIHASPNGAVLAGDKEKRAIAMSRLKAAGMVVGFPDLIVIWADRSGRIHVYGFEVKRPGEHPTEAQVTVGRILERNGGRWAVVRSVTDAEQCLRDWRGCIDG